MHAQAVLLTAVPRGYLRLTQGTQEKDTAVPFLAQANLSKVSARDQLDRVCRRRLKVRTCCSRERPLPESTSVVYVLRMGSARHPTNKDRLKACCLACAHLPACDQEKLTCMHTGMILQGAEPCGASCLTKLAVCTRRPKALEQRSARTHTQTHTHTAQGKYHGLGI